MKAKLISCLRDVKAESCGPISTFDTERDLIRSLQEFTKAHPESLPAAHPHDFVVYVVGEWDQDSGQMIAYDAPKTLGSLFDMITPKREVVVPLTPKKSARSRK